MKKKNESIRSSSLVTLSRRQFLQTTAATCLAASMMTACSGGDGQDDTFVPDSNDLDFKEGTWHKSYCGSCIWSNCGTEVKVQNGVAIEIRGNKNHPSNKGSLCTRGISMLANIYNPYRIKAPMKRTNPNKGFDVDPGWVEITWEEAINTAVEKMETVRTPADPKGDFHKMTLVYGFSTNIHEGVLFKLIVAGVFPGCNAMGSAGPLCDVHHAPGMFNTTFVDRVDATYCNYVIKLGRNISDNTVFASGATRALAEACDRGMKVINVDPHSGMGESKNGEWLPINPATDMAFLMGILHVMLWEDRDGNPIAAPGSAGFTGDYGMYDIDSVRWRSNAPYLIYCYPAGHPLHDLNGTYVRDGYDPGNPEAALADLVNVTRKPLIAEEVTNNFLTYDNFIDEDYVTQHGIGMPDFVYDDRVNGVGITTAFVLLRESVSDTGNICDAAGNKRIDGSNRKLLDAVEELTGISKEDIRRITNEYIDATTVDRTTKKGETITVDGVEFPLRPAAIAVGRGAANQVQGQRTYIVADIINLLMGAIGVPGSLVWASTSMFTFEDGMTRGDLLATGTTGLLQTFANRETTFKYAASQFYPTGMQAVLGSFYSAVLNPQEYGFDYDIELALLYGANPFTANGSQVLSEAAFKKIPYIINFGIDFDESAMFSDLLLPESSHYERTQVRPVDETMTVDQDNIHLRGMNYKEPPFPLVYNTRMYEDMILEISDRIGLYQNIIMMYNMFYGNDMLAASPHGTTSHQIHPNLDPAQKYTYKEICDHILKGLAGQDKGAEWFKENGFFMKNTPLKQCYEYYTMQVQLKGTDMSVYAGTPYANYSQTGRLPVYNYRDLMNGKYLRKALEGYTDAEGNTVPAYVNAAGDTATIPGWKPENMYRVHREFSPVPAWYDNFMVKPSFANGVANDAGTTTFGDDEYDMFAVNWKITIRNLGIGGQDSNAWLNEIRSTCEFDDWHIQMNPETAAAKGIKNGDDVRVISMSSGAAITGKVKLTNLIKKNCLGFPALAGHKSIGWNPAVRKGTNYNALLSSKEDWLLPDGGAVCVSARVKIEKA